MRDSKQELDYKKARREICKEYLLRHKTLDEARRALMRERGFGYNTSVWITALSHLLAEGKRPGGGTE